MHKNQILSCVACCIRLKCSALGEMKDDQGTKHGSLAGLTWCWSHSSVSQGVQHCDSKTKSGGNGRWLGVEAPAGAESRDRALRMPGAYSNQQDPSTLPPASQQAQTQGCKMTWWFTEVGQNGDTDHCQTQRNTKIHIGNLDSLNVLERHKKGLTWC